MRFLVLAIVLGLSLIAPAPGTASPVLDCTGCDGSNDADVVIGSGACSGESVSILINIDSGLCAYEYYQPPAPPGDCIQAGHCEATILRSWNNLVEGGDVTMCVVIPGVGERCNPQPPGGEEGASGSNTKYVNMDCGWVGWVFNMTTPCGTFAWATADCASCTG